MRRVKNTLLFLFTMALVAAGALMPLAAAELEDAYTTNASETWSFGDFSLTLRQDSDLKRALRVLNTHYILAEYSGETVLNEDTVLETATEILEWMVKCGVLNGEELEWLDRPSASCWLVCDADSYDSLLVDEAPSAAPENEATALAGSSTVVWDVEWNDGPPFFLRIDDTTGKMLTCIVQDPFYWTGIAAESSGGNQSAAGRPTEEDRYLARSINNNAENIFHLADNWRLFLSDHYGVEVALPPESWYDDSVRFVFELELEDGRAPLPIVLTIYSYGNVIVAPDVGVG